jgi:TonB family protein
VYKNILLRMRAVEAEKGKEREELISQADALGGRVAALQAAHPERSFLGMGGAIDQFAKVPADFKALVDSLHPVRADGRIKNPTLMRNTRHEYPPIARAVRIQGVVILEILIDVDGHVRAARVLRSIPLLDEAALACVRQWVFKPSVVSGASVAVLMNITESFVLQ